REWTVNRGPARQLVHTRSPARTHRSVPTSTEVRPDQRMSPSQRSLSILALFAALTVVHTWPLASNPAQLSRNDNADTLLNEWTIAWDAHQAVHDPRHLFDANIFYPEDGRYAIP